MSAWSPTAEGLFARALNRFLGGPSRVRPASRRAFPFPEDEPRVPPPPPAAPAPPPPASHDGTPGFAAPFAPRKPRPRGEDEAIREIAALAAAGVAARDASRGDATPVRLSPLPPAPAPTAGKPVLGTAKAGSAPRGTVVKPPVPPRDGPRADLLVSAFEGFLEVASERAVPEGHLSHAELIAWCERDSLPPTREEFATAVEEVLRRHGTGSGKAEGREEALAAFRANVDALFAQATRSLVQRGYCRSLPWVAARIQFAVAVGGSAAEADRSVERLARIQGLDVPSMYRLVSGRTGLRAATVDLAFWSAFAYGVEARS